MNRPDVFQRSVDALVRAYHNGHLAKYACNACAVGNLVAASRGTLPVMDPKRLLEFQDGTETAWQYVFCSGELKDRDVNDHFDGHSYDVGLSEIEATGYTVSELLAVEKAFEEATEIKYMRYKWAGADEIDQDQYQGLMAVIEVLLDIHQATDRPSHVNDFTLALQKA